MKTPPEPRPASSAPSPLAAASAPASSAAAAIDDPRAPDAALASDGDLVLLRRFQGARDEAAFAELLHRHWPMVLGVCRRSLAGRDRLAEDAAQEVFVLLARKAFWFRREVVLAGWLHRSALHICRTMKRSAARRLLRDDEAARRLALESAAPAAGDTWQQLRPELDAALDTLSPRLRAALTLCYLEGLTHREAGLRLGCAENAVTKRVERGLRLLRARLASRGVAVPAASLALALDQAAPEAQAAAAHTSPLVGVLAKLSPFALPGGLAIALAGLSGIALLPLASLLLLGGGTLLVLKNSPPAPTSSTPPPVESLVPSNADAVPPPATALTTPPPAPPSEKLAVASSTERLARLRRLTLDGYVKFAEELFLTRDASTVRRRLAEELGLEVDTKTAEQLLLGGKNLTLGVLTLLARQHPEDTLVWLAGFPPEHFAEAARLSDLAGALTAAGSLDLARLTALLPPGAESDPARRFLQTLVDPVSQASSSLAYLTEPKARRTQLALLASTWPLDKSAEAIEWAARTLPPDENIPFLAEFATRLAEKNPDETLLLLDQFRGTDALGSLLDRSMRGLVQTHRRAPQVVALVETLRGPARANAISELARRWARSDAESLVTWMNDLRDPADLRAALPLSLPQIDDTLYNAAMAELLPRLDGRQLDAALICAAMPSLGGPRVVSRSVDIVDRLTRLPAYPDIGSGRSDNAQLLWQAVNTTVEHWITQNGADPRTAAAWIERLPFATPADRATVAAKLHRQWRASAPAEADAWAQKIGLSPSPFP